MTTIDSLSRGKYISITTFRKSGEAVATPVWVTREGDALYVITGSDSGKVKRIRNNPHIEVAACDMRGSIEGPKVAATAQILDAAGTQQVQERVAKRFGLMYKLMTAMEKVRRRAGDRVGLKITLTESSGE